MVVSIVPRPVPDAPPPPRPIRALNRKTGLTITLVPSASVAGKYHIVGADRCDCRGFQATGRCRHLRQVQAERRPLADGGAAHLQVMRAAGEWPSKLAETDQQRTKRQADLYTEIWGRDGE